MIIFLELKVLAISSRNLLDAWKKRHSEGAEHPLKNGFKIQPEHRLEHQAVFRLSVSYYFISLYQTLVRFQRLYQSTFSRTCFMYEIHVIEFG